MSDQLPHQHKSKHQAVIKALAARDDEQLEYSLRQLSPQQQRQLLQDIAPQDRLRMLSCTDKPTELVQSLPTLQLHQTLEHADDNLRLSLMSYGNGEQIGGLFDLACFHGLDLDDYECRQWLEQLSALEGDAAERILTSLSIEQWQVILGPVVDIDVDPSLIDLHRDMGTPYPWSPADITCHDDHAELLIEEIYSFFASDDFAALCVGLSEVADIDLHSLHFAMHERSRAQMGLPDGASALTIYQALLFPRATATGHTAVRELTIQRDGHVLYLDAVLQWWWHSGGCSTHLREAWDKALAQLATKVVLADGSNPGSEQMALAMRKAKRYVGLGLEWRSAGDPGKLHMLLRSAEPEREFRCAAGLMEQLRQRAAQVQDQEGDDMRGLIASICSAKDPACWQQNGAITEIERLADWDRMWDMLA